jgi:hypothetical protein
VKDVLMIASSDRSWMEGSRQAKRKAVIVLPDLTMCLRDRHGHLSFKSSHQESAVVT